METNPSVSVIVTIHNAERHIKECVNSLVSQNLRHLEIVLADDNSTDGSFELCRKLYGGKGKFKLVRNENPRSLGATRNLGLKHASGDYVCFARGDDFLLPGALKKFYSVAKETGAEVIRAAGWYDSAKAAASKQPTWSVYAQQGFLNSNLLNKLEEHWKKGATSSQAELCFVRRKFLQDNGITFRETCAADELFNFALLCTTKRYYILHEAFYVRRDVEDATTAEEFSEGLRAMLDGAAYLDSFLERMPRFKGYESWRENLLASFFYKFAAKYTIPFQKTSSALDASIEQTLTPYFPSGKSFAKYFFKSFNTLSRQAEFLAKQHKQLSAEMMALFNRLELADSKIVFVNFLGRGFGCNPKYIALEIMRQDLPVDMVWLVGDMNEPMPSRIRKVRYGSVDSVYELATAKVIVTNVKNLLPFPAKKDGQFFIMTWHGGQGFKLIEGDAEERLSPAYVRESKANSSITDLMMVNTQEQYDEFRRACWYDGEILRCGLPRNDIFFRHDEKLTAQVRQALNVPTTNKVVMYAPTFRDNLAVMMDVCRLDTQRLLEVMRKRFGGDWTLIMRFHPNVARYFAQAAFGDNVINATDYPDMQELILIADALISDYSSVVCDFMFTGKPVFLYAKDCDTYTTERGFKPLYFDLPYKVNKSAEELFDDIETYNAAAVEPKIKHFVETVKPFDDGHASETVVERIKAFITPPPQVEASNDFFRQLLASPVFKSNMELLAKVSIQEKDTQNALQTLNLVEDKYYYELLDERPWKPRILDVPSGIEELIASGKSFCRLGDGECKLMNGIGLDFQQYDRALAEKLLQILEDEQTNCYVGLPRYYWYIRDDIERNDNPYHKRYYTLQIPPIRKFFAEHCNRNKTYLDACLGGYMSNKSLAFCAERFEQLKTLFRNKKLLIVAGETVFNNLTHDFFEEAAQKEFLFAPRVNAWTQYEAIKEQILSYPKNFLVTLILGPTATVLAYELSKAGYTAYDIGHVPKDYDAFKKNADRSAGAIAKFYAAD